MSDVTAFLRARLDDDEKIANTAIGLFTPGDVG